jgi:hypothetical protein
VVSSPSLARKVAGGALVTPASARDPID